MPGKLQIQNQPFRGHQITCILINVRELKQNQIIYSDMPEMSLDKLYTFSSFEYLKKNINFEYLFRSLTTLNLDIGKDILEYSPPIFKNARVTFYIYFLP